MSTNEHNRVPHVQPQTHPFRRYIPSTEDNARDEWFVVAHSSIIGYRTRGGKRAQGGGR